MFLALTTILMAIGAMRAAPQQPGFFNQNQFNRIPQFNRAALFQPPQSFPTVLPQAAYQYNPRNFVPITSYQNEVSHDGSFSYGYTAGDGTTAQAQGYLKNAGRKDLEAQVVQGSYSYTSPEGTPIRVTYIADENGFRAEGAHLPTPPPIPDAIAKSLQFIARVQPLQQFNQNANTYQNQQQQYQPQTRQNQLNIQQQQQQSGQYQPQQQYNNAQQLTQQQQQQQQQQNQQTQQQRQQQLSTQPFFGRPNQIATPFAFNKFGRYKK